MLKSSSEEAEIEISERTPWPQPGRPSLALAPMEGVIDAPLRTLLAERGGFDYCVSEFVRVTQLAPPGHMFRRIVPELETGARTVSGLTVQVQLLGGDPELLAEAAVAALEAGATGIDLNFGCPAPTVNRHDGGATLLRHPQRIRAIVEAVRGAIPRGTPVSAKLRLGWESINEIHLNAEMAAQGGASWITIHGRTKLQGYTPPAHWRPIGEVRARLGIPVVANGEIWSLEDFKRCREATGSEHFMLGRGALADPRLAVRIRRELGCPGVIDSSEFDENFEWRTLLGRYVEIMRANFQEDHRILRRIKQWMGMVGIRFPAEWIEALKRTQSLEEAFRVLR